MRDILLNESGDIWLDENGDIALAESVVQEAKIRLKWFLGEWVFGPGLGMPWFGEVLVKNPDLGHIKRRMAGELRRIGGVLDVPRLDIRVDKRERTANVVFALKTWEGTCTGEVALFGKRIRDNA